MNSLQEKSVKSCGKWILSGEHTVLRGGKAILFPLKKFFFEIRFKESHHSFGNIDVVLDSVFPLEKFRGFYTYIIKKSLSLINKSRVSGVFCLNCAIPMAMGLGGSSAFCVSLAKIFFYKGWIQEKDIPKLSLELEHEFHGKSSGADIQVVYREQPCIFTNFHQVEVFKLQWKPYFYLMDTKSVSSTKDCVQKVSDFIKKNPLRGKELDQQMQESVLSSIQAFNMEAQKGELLLAKALNQALECFVEWGLCDEKVKAVMQNMKQKGALAVKPTGSGGGGFVVGLWNKPLPSVSDMILG